MNFWKKKSAFKKITVKADRKYQFTLMKYHDSAGFSYFTIENRVLRQMIVVRKYMFERFRSFISDIVEFDQFEARGKYILYKQRQMYFFCPDKNGEDGDFLLKEIDPLPQSTGFLNLTRKSMKALFELLYHKDLREPHDLLGRIVAYHKIFQFTFIDKQESMNSDLSIRKELLSHLATFTPRGAASKNIEMRKIPEVPKIDQQKLGKKSDLAKQPGKENKDFEKKLGARSGHSPYNVNYDVLLKATNHRGKSPLKKEVNQKKDGKISYYALSLTSSTVKQYNGKPFECEFDPDEISYLRRNFLEGDHYQYYLGMEIVQAVFKKDSKYKAFTFPLYYMKVDIKQANRVLYIDSTESGRIYLNHIAIANLVETFNLSASKDTLDRFLNTLLKQNIEVKGKISRVFLSRTLPVDEEYFSKSREILLGDEGRDGKSGILSDLKVIGLECDVSDVYLYRSHQHLTIISQALEADLDQILQLATDEAPRFDRSLLGQFIRGKSQRGAKSEQKSAHPWMPGALPPSMKKLMKNISDHDLIVLEGPPGTGKTHTIRNIVVDAICSGKRLMIVSDRASALEALVDKLEEYFLEGAVSKSEREHLSKLWQRSIPVVDHFPDECFDMGKLFRSLKKAFPEDQEPGGPLDASEKNELNKKFEKNVREWEDLSEELSNILQTQLNPEAEELIGSATRRGQPTSKDDIETLINFLGFLSSRFKYPGHSLSVSGADVVESFIKHRNWLKKDENLVFYRFFNLDQENAKYTIKDLRKVLETIKICKPDNCEDLIDCLMEIDHEYLTRVLSNIFNEIEPLGDSLFKRIKRKVLRLFRHPLHKLIKELEKKIDSHELFLKLVGRLSDSIKGELKKIDGFIDPEVGDHPFPLSLELCLYKIALKQKLKRAEHKGYSITPYQILVKLQKLQKARDSIVAQKVQHTLLEISLKLDATKKGERTPRKTRIAFLFDQIKGASSLNACQEVLKSLQESLWEAFPIWICRKQVVPLLLPCREKSLDLLIVDEATQCRVDETLPLLLRSKKLLVVGDDKQTVLAKESSMDDYLFREFNLPEHLTATQATNIKGGGSHIFGLLKNIQQASVILDEHYRCPPDIIAYSNKYVYDDQLKIMQWEQKGAAPSVYIDYSEEHASEVAKPTSGPFKGIDVAMIERFLSYMESEIKKIEKQLGRKVDVEKEVAICYFLLKNNTYFDDIKSKFLGKLNRGKDILSGAGAALQGKERDYIFYFWDCNRSNFGTFKQGDDESKRKGELNVLMSRPRKRAYHYLHGKFANLSHDKSSITDYLWNHYQDNDANLTEQQMLHRMHRPLPEHPLNRGSGQLMLALIRYLAQGEYNGEYVENIDDYFFTQFSKAVGNPKFLVDLVLSPKDESKKIKSLCLLDISCFSGKDAAAEVIDYYFQLQRAKPGLKPIFCFIHELIEKEGLVMNEIMKSLLGK